MLSEAIGNLINLERLTLTGSQITKLPSQIGQLVNLKWLELSNNQLVNLPPTIQKLSKLEKLDLRGNQLNIPPEILGEDRENLGDPVNILSYYFSLQAEETKPLNEAKVLLVGQGNVGKTSLVKRLIEDSYDPHEGKTEGINIQNWQIPVNEEIICLNMWDFGGQEIMHATHQFFLTKRSLYLVVINAREDERSNRLEYWLKIIQSFGGDSPIIIVGNKIDQHPLDIDQSKLRRKYGIRHILPVSCKTKDGIEQLRAAIIDELENLEHIHDLLPQSWFKVKTRLETMAEDYISYKQYEEICREEQVINKYKQSTLIDFLHDLGIILNFRKDPRLAEMGVLNPEWVTNGVYKILNDNRLILEYRGILDCEQLQRILEVEDRRYDDKQLFIVDMIQKFELCFRLEDKEDRFLIPDLLPKEEPATGILPDEEEPTTVQWQDILRFRYHYNVLPSSIISRFIVRMHRYSDRQTWWRSGIVLKHNNSRALVRSDEEDRNIVIYIKGSGSNRRELLAIIRSNFNDIHQTIKGLVAEEQVGFPEGPDCFEDYENVLEHEKQGLPIIPKGSKRQYDPRQLLDGIEPIENRNKPYIPDTNSRNIPMSNNQPEERKPSSQPSPAERGIALAMALAVLVLFIVIVLYPRQMDGGTQAIVRFLAATLAGIGAYFFTGTLDLKGKIPLSKTQIKATGAFAAFVLVLLLFFFGVPGFENSNQPNPTPESTIKSQ